MARENMYLNKSDFESYAINVNACSGCELCLTLCPVNAIKKFGSVVQIDQDECVRCGFCKIVCPLNSVVSPQDTQIPC